jgi:hypothetical protein
MCSRPHRRRQSRELFLMGADFIVMLIGEGDDTRSVALAQNLDNRTKRALQASRERLHVVDQHALDTLDRNVPRVAVVFCREDMTEAESAAVSPEIAAIKKSIERSIPIIPVIQDLTRFGKEAPKEVEGFNGFQLANMQDIPELAGLVLELIGLQRAKRKIFISYARLDGGAMAQQLYEAFTARWYSVFLDTVSIRPGAVFQQNLKEELADSDVVVLLNSPTAMGRPYVKEEIAFANSANVGGVQVVWPGRQPAIEGRLFMPHPLKDEHIASEEENGKSLKPEAILEVLRRVADLRTELHQQREEELLRPIEAYAQSKRFNAVHYLGRYIELREQHGAGCVRLDLALGVPTSRDLERALRNALPRPPEGGGRLVYDPVGITKPQLRHLRYLSKRLKLESFDPQTALQWNLL